MCWLSVLQDLLHLEHLLLHLELGEERAEARAPAVHPLYPPVSLELELKVRNVKFSIFLSEGRGKTENKHH